MQQGIDSEYLQVVDLIKDKLLSEIRPEAILLFGSGARGDVGPDSDVDLFVVWDEMLDLPNIKRQIMLRRIIGPVERPVDVLTCSTKELKDSLGRAHPFTQEILREGVVLYGGLN